MHSGVNFYAEWRPAYSDSIAAVVQLDDNRVAFAPDAPMLARIIFSRPPACRFTERPGLPHTIAWWLNHEAEVHHDRPPV